MDVIFWNKDIELNWICEKMDGLTFVIIDVLHLVKITSSVWKYEDVRQQMLFQTLFTIVSYSMIMQ